MIHPRALATLLPTLLIATTLSTPPARAQGTLTPPVPLPSAQPPPPAPGPATLTELAARRALETGLPSIAAEIYRQLLADPATATQPETRNRLTLALATALIEDDRTDEAAIALRQFTGPPTPAHLLRQAMIDARARYFNTARATAATLAPDDLPDADRPWLHFLLGLLAEEARDYTEAGRQYQQAEAATTNPVQHAWFALSRTRTRLLLGQTADADIARLRQTIDRNPGTRNAHSAIGQLAIALNATGRRAEAITLLQTQLQSLAPQETDIRDDWLLLLGLIAGPDDNTGRDALRRLLAASADRDKQRAALRLLANASRATRSKERAAEFGNWLNQFIAAAPPHPILDDLLLFRAQLALDGIPKNHDAAENDITRLLTEFPGSPLRANALGVQTAIAWEQGRYRAAADWATRARAELKTGPACAQLGLLIAEAYFRAKDYRNASDAYRVALADVPDGVNAGALIFQRVLSEMQADPNSDTLATAQKILDTHTADPRLDPVNRWRAEWNLVRALQAAGETAQAYTRINNLLPPTRAPAPENQEPETENREPGTENREPSLTPPSTSGAEAPNREPGTVNREPSPTSGAEAPNREPGTVNREPSPPSGAEAPNREPGTVNREPPSPPASGAEAPTVNRKLETVNTPAGAEAPNREPGTENREPSSPSGAEAPNREPGTVNREPSSPSGAEAPNREPGTENREPSSPPALPPALPPDLRARMAWLQMRLAYDSGNYQQAAAYAEKLRTSLGDVTPGLRDEITSMTLLLEVETGYALAAPGQAIPAETTTLLQKLRADYPKTSAAIQSYIIEAAEVAKRDRLVEAQSLLRKLADDYPDTPYASYALFQAATYAESRGQEQYRDANRLLEDLIQNEQKKNPGAQSELVFYARLRQGNLARKINDFGSAINIFRELVNNYKFPEHPEGLVAELALADSYAALVNTDASYAESAAAIFERLFDLPNAPIDLRIEAGHKFGLNLIARKDYARLEATWWQMINDFLLNDTSAAKLGATGHYWMSRTLLKLGELLEEQSRNEEARKFYQLIITKNLPGAALAQDRITRSAR